MAAGGAPLHLPVLRCGTPYRSLEAAPLVDLRTGEPVAELGMAHPALIARDLSTAGARAGAALAALPFDERLAICCRAADCFALGELAIGCDGETQSPDGYLRQLAATAGMPLALGRANLEKLRATLAQMAEVIDGLTRGLPAAAFAGAAPEQGAAAPQFQRQSDLLGAVLPSNSPGVHGIWLPAPALGVGLALKPGRGEPWTPLRLLHALAAAGWPREALSYYPTAHAGGAEILLRCGRSLLFGDQATVAPWRGDARVQVHGPGLSKVLFGADQLADWPAHLELVASSILANGGRSCTNASGVWLPAPAPGAAAAPAAPAAPAAGSARRGGPSSAEGRELAEALARRLAAVEARPLDDPRAQLAAWPDAAAARRVSDWIDRRLAPGEAEDLTAEVRGGGRLTEVDGCTFLLPTLIWVRDPGHPLAHAELLFPFCAVVEAPADELLSRIGPTLVATAVTADEELRRQLLDCRAIDHLHLGAVPTWQVSFAQPHEGNLFDLLYRRRAVREAPLHPAWPAATVAGAVAGASAVAAATSSLEGATR
jgi:acyl-CoA reductase-like NAD-dependent aldehyde dehydrogenase